MIDFLKVFLALANLVVLHNLSDEVSTAEVVTDGHTNTESASVVIVGEEILHHSLAKLKS